MAVDAARGDDPDIEYLFTCWEDHYAHCAICSIHDEDDIWHDAGCRLGRDLLHHAWHALNIWASQPVAET